MSDNTATSDPTREVTAGTPAHDMSRLWLVGGIAAVVLLGSLAYGIAVAVTATPSAPAAAPSNPVVRPDWPADDIRWLLAVMPGDAKPIDSLGSADHTLTIDQATAIYGDTNQSLTYLGNLGYLRGAAMAWRADSPRYDVRISLLQFGAAAQAAAWATDLQRSLGAGVAETPAPLAEIPGGLWFVVEQQPDAGFRVVHAVFHQGAIGAYITFWCYPSVMPAVVNAIAAHQYGKLPTV